MKRISLRTFMQDKQNCIYYRVINNQVQVITALDIAANQHLCKGGSVPRFLIKTAPLQVGGLPVHNEPSLLRGEV